MSSVPLPIHGRGAGSNPPNRFEPILLEPDFENLDPNDPAPSPQTEFFRDTSCTVLAHNDSPDVGFEYSINPYRGCEHGCVYCYARPTHEYLSLSAGVDFETKILVKHDAPELLRKELMNPRWSPQTISINGKEYSMTMRPERIYQPFSLTLLKATHSVYPGSDIPKDFRGTNTW